MTEKNPMSRTLALSISFLALAQPALSVNQVDPATVTCKEYNGSSHQGMVDINAAVYQSTREDPKLGEDSPRTSWGT